MPSQEQDALHIATALRLATSALLLTDPNPRVGCVLCDAEGHVLGQGHTQKAGGPHAEVMALRDAAAQGNSVEGATAYVTLEPCSHHGRTGPCCDALIAAGVRRVVASLADPNPLVAGQGFDRLRAAGVQVEVGPGAAESRELNIGFFSRMVRKQPWVRMKVAASLDGKTGLENGVSQWITAEAARTDGHAWRARASAVLTGVGTVIEDNPRLDVRLVETPRQPHLVVVDSRLQTPPDAHIFIAGRPVWIYAASRDEEKAAALEARGATVTCLPNADGKVDLPALLRDLAARGVNELHVESGHKLNGSMLREDCVDELLVYLAPKLIGKGLDIASHLHAGGPLTSLAGALPLEFKSVDMLGPDLRVLARVAGKDAF
ncbi:MULTISPECIES: bifunctional diaminohydroxyphosphoribosylaminopyrimidine deaminase/5-amino-6-(5-phosphoribosylamino)uracil reductase RibD [unclassified Variovorax]|uniref:bifunctional diaminohydroxyphosphoribosylaminopyrimidine deaminase/5-amino-6-(5-phosphoribosylamino)uracil reductase RibD n=1 Tax=unclassified Variovorax TaxID=663243 RepID=UPI0008B32EF4|nr:MULTISPECIES: bifunctional diaminohydroxyphosphoribosylaminopyrimidine deaminase/5-amino-6-(5-phosphoribosylamino)uracil reductase RibD [unclassified Variovorax]SEK02649.1 diaminohydroxyphosphoribosylaminopyrimidine deaminase / 5-amino-6-(5-phosphoribosylamino)uracil reductase [Variovorax sp. OK202]SFD34506.1 diaminohydroxyphosphoribosylaminopyrimidine deaminase / 5-amino-6-(5-phosphoribosylamino)uracil reductase [Variovorax sp. OK212]